MKCVRFAKPFLILLMLMTIFACNSSSGGDSQDGRDKESPSTPSSLNHVISQNEVNLSWPTSADNVGVSRYRIYRNGAMISETTGTSYTDASIADPGRYCYSVSAIDEAGNESDKSPEVCVDVTDIFDKEPPTAPSGLKACVEYGSARLEWSSSVDNVGVFGYFVYRNGHFLNYTQDTNFTDDDIAENAEYTYTVTARDMMGNESSGCEVGINTTKDRIKWHFETSSNVVGHVGVVSDGTVYAADRDRLYAIDSEGREKWSYAPQEGNEYGSLLVANSDSIYLMTTENLYSINSSGVIEWKKTLSCGALIATSESGTVFVSDCESIYAFARNGSIVWQKNLDAMLFYGSGKVDAEGNLYIVEPDFLMAIGPDGTEKWKSDSFAGMLQRQIELSPDGSIYILSFSSPPAMTETLYSFSKDGVLRYSNSSMSYSPPVVVDADGIVYVCGKSDSLFALNPEGSTIWEKMGAYPSAGLPPTSLSIGKDGNLLLMDSNNGYLRTFKPDGTVGWKFYTGVSETAPSILTDGTMVVGSENGIYALKP